MKTVTVENTKEYYLTEPEFPYVGDIYVDAGQRYIKAFIFDNDQEWKEVVDITKLTTGDIEITYMDEQSNVEGDLGDDTEQRDYLYRLGI